MRKFAVTCAFAIGLVSGIAASQFVMRSQNASFVIDPQTEMISILEDEVMSITFISDKFTVTAQRSKPGATFAVQVTYADGQLPQQCLAPANLSGQLSTYTSIKTKRPLKSQEQAKKEFPIKVGILELRDRIEAEPITSIQLRTDSDHKAMVALYENVTLEVANPESAFVNLEKACEFLASYGKP